jgi:hypothetical protein
MHARLARNSGVRKSTKPSTLLAREKVVWDPDAPLHVLKCKLPGAKGGVGAPVLLCNAEHWGAPLCARQHLPPAHHRKPHSLKDGSICNGIQDGQLWPRCCQRAEGTLLRMGAGPG